MEPTTSKPCHLCTETSKNWEGGDRKCAFLSGVFDKDNWNCETLGQLLQLSTLGDEQGTHGPMVTYSGDRRAMVIPISDESDYGDFIVLSWYKERGQIKYGAIIDTGATQPLTLEAAQATLRYHKEKAFSPNRNPNGWEHFGDPFEIESLDDCNRFKNDEEARIAHRTECGCSWPEFDYHSAFSAWWTSHLDASRDLMSQIVPLLLLAADRENFGKNISKLDYEVGRIFVLDRKSVV